MHTVRFWPQFLRLIWKSEVFDRKFDMFTDRPFQKKKSNFTSDKILALS